MNDPDSFSYLLPFISAEACLREGSQKVFDSGNVIALNIGCLGLQYIISLGYEVSDDSFTIYYLSTTEYPGAVAKFTFSYNDGVVESRFLGYKGKDRWAKTYGLRENVQATFGSVGTNAVWAARVTHFMRQEGRALERLPLEVDLLLSQEVGASVYGARSDLFDNDVTHEFAQDSIRQTLNAPKNTLVSAGGFLGINPERLDSRFSTATRYFSQLLTPVITAVPRVEKPLHRTVALSIGSNIYCRANPEIKL